MRRFAILLVAVSGLFQNAAAQLPPVPEGGRVRLLAIGGYRASGTASLVTLDSITVDTGDGQEITLPYAALRQLEVRRVKTSTFKAATRGFLIGAGIGVVATAAAAIGGGGSISLDSSKPIIGISAGAGTVLGAIFLRSNAWEVVPLPAIAR